MIEIRVERDAERFTKEIEIKGHAGYGEKGKDIVCAAVSILAQSLLSTLLELAEYEWVFVLDYKMDDGYIRVSYEEPVGNVIDISVMEMMFDKGIDLLIESYPDHIKRV